MIPLKTVARGKAHPPQRELGNPGEAPPKTGNELSLNMDFIFNVFNFERAKSQQGFLLVALGLLASSLGARLGRLSYSFVRSRL